ncbi:Protein Y38H6C.8, partial [Aphelenchoides avenae]
MKFDLESESDLESVLEDGLGLGLGLGDGIVRRASRCTLQARPEPPNFLEVSVLINERQPERIMRASPQRMFLLVAAFCLVQCIAGFCPPPGIQSPLNESVCYQIRTAWTDFYSAADICTQANGGNLTSIHNAFTNSFLRDQAAKTLAGVANSFFVGANDWNSEELEAGNWTWMDGTPLDYTNWARGEPVKGYKNCAAVAIRDGQWRAESCYYGHHAFVCELLATEDLCDYGWRAFNGSCYRWFPQVGTFLYPGENATSWSKANQT